MRKILQGFEFFFSVIVWGTRVGRFFLFDFSCVGKFIRRAWTWNVNYSGNRLFFFFWSKRVCYKLEWKGKDKNWLLHPLCVIASEKVWMERFCWLLRGFLLALTHYKAFSSYQILRAFLSKDDSNSFKTYTIFISNIVLRYKKYFFYIY